MTKHAALIAFAMAASLATTGNVLASEPGDAPQEPSNPPMKCEPSVVRPGDTLRITLPFPHGPYLTVREPNVRPHSYLFLTHPWRTQEELGDSAISGDRFQRMRTLDIIVSKTKAIPWVVKAKPQLIFMRRGKYLFELGDQFETEAMIIESTCTVEFRR